MGGAIAAGLVVHELRAHARRTWCERQAASRTRLRTATALATRGAGEAGAAGLAMAALDVIVIRLDRRRRLRMSKDEVARRTEGVRGGSAREGGPRASSRRGARAEGAILDVRRARVVVRNERDERRERTAAAPPARLRWDEARGDRAPLDRRVVGRGAVAEAIVREARAHGVAVLERDAVASALGTREAGEEIPEALYEDVAEILRDA